MTEAEDARDEIGSLSEEAAKLFGAFSGWAREQADGHLATGSDECTMCPICRTVHAVRQLGPEVTAHLTSAMTSLAEAVEAVMAAVDPGSEGSQSATPSEGGVEPIDLDGEWPDDA